MKLLLWNVEWNQAEWRRRVIREVIEREQPVVNCFTEATASLVEREAYAISATADYGYPQAGDRRKVWLTSTEAWADVDFAENSNLPPGRFVSGITHGIRFVGVCIPWSGAHVANGNRDRKTWEDHLLYLDALRPILEDYRQSEHPLCVLGDFNQRIPPASWNRSKVQPLRDALGPDINIATQDFVDVDGAQLIDHVAICPQLQFSIRQTISRHGHGPARLSDHAGILGDLSIIGRQPNAVG